MLPHQSKQLTLKDTSGLTILLIITGISFNSHMELWLIKDIPLS